MYGELFAVEQTREENGNTVEKNGIVGGGRRRFGESEVVRGKKRRERGGVREGSEIGEREAEGDGVEAEGGNVEVGRVSHVEIEEHGVGGDEEGERLDGEQIEEEIGGDDRVRKESSASDAEHCDGSFEFFQWNSGGSVRKAEDESSEEDGAGE